MAPSRLVLFMVALAAFSCSNGKPNSKDANKESTIEITDVPDIQVKDTGSIEELEQEIDAADAAGEMDLPLAPDVFKTGVPAKGFGEHCESHTDCAPWGLMCFRWGAEDPDPICSWKCEDPYDCPEYFVCDYKYGFAQPVTICKQAEYCSPCEADIQCSLSGMKCIRDKKGGKFCSYPCKPGILSCNGGSRCIWVEEEQGFYCMPYWGACVGNGSVCAPCKVEEDCSKSGTHCVESYYSHERFCTLECTGSKDCPHGFDCFDVGGNTGLCFMTFNGQYIPTCHKGVQEFCGECRGDYECATGLVCYIGPENTGHYCSMPCTADDQCPLGSRCTTNFDVEGSAKGFACALKEGYECSSFLTPSQHR